MSDLLFSANLSVNETIGAGTAQPSGALKFIYGSYLSGIRVTRSLVLFAYFVDRCLSVFFWSFCYQSFFDLRILIKPLVSSNSSYIFRTCGLTAT